MPKKTRLDLLMAQRGLAESRERAQRLIRAGLVVVEGRRIDKPGTAVPSEAAVVVNSAGPRFVSRGGEKLQAGLDRFALSPRGRVCLDLGASTGGFCDCLLQAGALRVHAVDVGRGQLHERLRADPRVISHERLNARRLTREILGETVGFCTADLSFISLLTVIPAAAPLMEPDAPLAALIKPQFEAGRRHVRRGGVVLDPKVHRDVLERVLSGIAELGFDFRGLTVSPLRGPAGNREYLAWLARAPGSPPPPDAIEAAVAEAFPGESH
jgi:23S rRNA (cytidine1920-2'-O)/16S rRNA (cytidine1409-2'-O)-methyltransferase